MKSIYHRCVNQNSITILDTITTIIQLANIIININLLFYHIFCEAKNASKKSKELYNEISEFSFIMNNLINILKTIEENFDIIITNIISLNSLQIYLKFLMNLSSHIQVNKNEIKKRLK